jgi:hypothetical protein
MRRRGVYFVLPALLAVGVVVPSGPSASAAATPPAATDHTGPAGDHAATAADPASAAAAARASGQRVEALSLRSGERQVFANPDGTLTAEVTAGPVRVRQPDGSWSPVDPTLRREPDGSVAPVATVAGLRLSGGGVQPLVTLTHGSRSLSLGWPHPLPTPTLDGASATYAAVLPGVDLQVTAQASGFAEQLVVKSAAAAANPELVAISFPLSTAGVSLHAGDDGALRALDGAGRPVFEAPQPTMWDTPASSATAPSLAGPAVPGADSTAPADRRERPMEVSVSGSAITVRPDQALLTDPAARFPLVLDPTFTTYGSTTRKEVDFYHPTSSTFSTVPAGNLAMGFQDFEPVTRVRSFVAFPLSSLIWGATISSATLSLYELYSASHDTDCHIATRAQLWVTGGVTASTTWNTQPPWGGLAADSDGAYGNGANPSCSARTVEFNVTSRIATAASVHNGITFGIKASDETDGIGWRKFSAAADKVKLTVNYNHPPTVGGTTTTPSTSPACYYSSSAPGGNAGTPPVNPGAAGMVLHATTADADQNHPAGHSESLRTTFQIWRFGGSAPLWSKTVGPAKPGPVAAPTVRLFETADPSNPDKILHDQTVYNWRVSATDGTGTSPWSGWCQFKIDLTHPNTPQVSSTLYAQDSWSGGVGVPGAFTLDANGSADATAFRYSFDTPTLASQVAVGTGGSTVLPTYTPTAAGIHHLYATSVNKFGVVSALHADYRFFVDPASQPYGQWKLDESDDASAAADTGTGGHPAAATGTGWAWGNGRVDGGVSFDGTPGSYLSTTASLSTTAAFSVSAWVTLADPDLDFTAVSQDGTYLLGYCAGHFVFAVGTSDCSGGTAVVTSTTTPTSSTWYHLAGVYDSAAHLLRLYVDGAANGTPASYTGTVPTAGAIQLGCASCSADVPDSELPWGLDDVRAYDRLLTAAEVTGIVNTAWQEVGRWAFDEASGTSAADGSSNGYTATLSGGAAFAAGGHAGNAVNFAGTAPAATTQLPVLRLDRSFSVTAWVKPTAATGTHTVLSQDGEATSGFVVQYVNDGTGSVNWVFGMPATDTTPPDYGSAANFRTAPATGFVHVAVVYDVSSDVLSLWVNGQRRSTGVHDQPWNANGVLQIGRDKAGGPYGDYWAGLVDDVHVYWGVVSDDLIRQQAGI